MRKGFTLVELSIVLIIIGLLIGAVVGGSSLIKASKVQAVVSDFGKYKEAIVKFNEKYYYWPGDQPDASDRWTGASNGDGDGYVEGCGSGDICGSGEVYYGPKILALDGFIPGTYSGTAPIAPDSSFPSSQIDIIPGGNLSAPIYLILYDTSLVSKNAFYLADVTGTTMSNAIPSGQAAAIDSKMDDAVPGTGIVRGFGLGGTCIASGAYDVSTDGAGCVIAYTLE